MREGPIVQQTSVRRPGFRRQLVTAGIIVGAIVIVLVVSYFTFLPKQQRYLLESYTWSTVQRKDIPEALQASGTIDLAETADITAPEPGSVERLLISTGQDVKKGAVLLRIAPAMLEGQLDDLQAQLSAQARDMEEQKLLREIEIEDGQKKMSELAADESDAEAALTLAQKLQSSGNVTPAQVTEAQRQVDRARRSILDQQSAARMASIRYDYSVRRLTADQDLTRSRIEKLKARIDACTVRSPVNGRVMMVSVAPGSTVSAYAPLATIGDFNRPVANLTISQNVAHRVTAGQQASISLGEQQYRGIVERKGLLAEQLSPGQEARVAVRLAFVEVPKEFTPGSTAAVEILIGMRPDVLFLPRGPFLTTGAGLTLYRIEGTRAFRIDVGIGIATSSDVEIVKGVEEGDRIITSSYQDFAAFKEITLAPAGGASDDQAR